MVVKLKVEHGHGEVSHVTVADSRRLGELRQKVGKLLPIKSDSRIQYRDRDGEMVTIWTAEDLEDCIRSEKAGEPPKIYLSALPKPFPSSKARCPATTPFRITAVALLVWMGYLALGPTARRLTQSLSASAPNAITLPRNGLPFSWPEPPAVTHPLPPYAYPTPSNSTDDFLLIMPTHGKKLTRTYGCTGCQTPEPYSKKCYEQLQWKMRFTDDTRMDVLRRASKKPAGDYPGITGFANVVIDTERYLDYIKRGDPVMDIQLKKLADSGLLDVSSLRLRVGLLKSTWTTNQTLSKVKWTINEAVERFTCGAKKPVTIEYWDPSNYECDTLMEIKKWCDQPHHQNDFVYYFHNKGKSRERNSWEYMRIRHWREYMMFFLFERWKLCVNSLMQGKSTCGVDLQTDGNGVQPHYSGNFFWARCDWIHQLKPDCEFGRANKNKAEMFLLRDPYNKMRLGGHPDDRPEETKRMMSLGVSLWDSAIDHYRSEYPRSNYSCADLAADPSLVDKITFGP